MINAKKLFLATALGSVVAAAACDTSPTLPSQPTEATEPDIWEVVFEMTEALGGRVAVGFSQFEEEGVIRISVLPPSTLPPGAMESDDDPICSKSFDSGWWGNMKFAKCVTNAMEIDVCNNGGQDFKIEMVWGKEKFHTYCPE